MDDELVDIRKQLTSLQKQIENLVKPEIPLGMSLISETILSGSAATVTFSSISQSYRHLMLMCQVRTDAAAENDGLLLRFNGDSGANYDWILLLGNAGAAASGVVRAGTSIQPGAIEAANSRASNFSPVIINITGYTNTANEKWLIAESAVFGDVSADADMFLNVRAGRWRNTAAITSITLVPSTGPNFVSGSRFQLYGVR